MEVDEARDALLAVSDVLGAKLTYHDMEKAIEALFLLDSLLVKGKHA